jgi:hypothetical protein
MKKMSCLMKPHVNDVIDVSMIFVSGESDGYDDFGLATFVMFASLGKDFTDIINDDDV